MKKTLSLLVVLPFFFVPGCGASDSPETAMKDMLAYGTELASTLEKVTDKASLQAAIPALKALKERSAAIEKRLKDMKPPTSAEKDALLKKLEPQTKPLKERLSKAYAKVDPFLKDVPDAAKILEELPKPK